MNLTPRHSAALEDFTLDPPAGVTHNSAGHSREVVLVALFGLMLVLLVLTAFIARLYHKDVHMLADGWFAKGEDHFRAGDATEAAKDYRNALVYSPGNSVFQFHLAQALVAAGKNDEARSYLLNLLADSPASGEINLELARIAVAKAESMQDVLRYYSGAIYGVWDANLISKRWDVRRELCEYLLAHGMATQAQPEITALSQDVPPGDVARQKKAGELLLRAKVWHRAFEEYRAILTAHRRDPDALAGAAIASFQEGQYGRAAQYFGELPREQRADPRIAAMLDTARNVDAANPFLPGLSNVERARRTATALARAKSLVDSCSARQGAAGKSSRQAGQLEGLKASFEDASIVWRQQNLAHDPAQVDAAMNWVFQVEETAGQSCGESLNADDRALLLIAQSRASAEP